MSKKINNRIAIASVAFLTLAMAILLGIYAFRGALFFSEPLEAVSQETFHHPLTGHALGEDAASLPRVFAVVVENAADAWPLSGIDQAFLVVEAPVEARIPRLLAFFHEEQDEISKIGPVRSARPYFVELAQGMDALFAHVGGSPAALTMIEQEDVFDLNQYWNGSRFWRSVSREAPHNVFTSLSRLKTAMEKFDESGRVPEPDYPLWTFSKEEPHGGEHQSSMLEIKGQFAGYRVGWSYDKEANRYQRFQVGEPLILEDGAQVFADNVILLKTSMRVLDDVGRRAIDLSGEGGAEIWQGGREREIVWNKESAADRLMFYEKDGDDVTFLPGITWIEIIEN